MSLSKVPPNVTALLVLLGGLAAGATEKKAGAGETSDGERTTGAEDEEFVRVPGLFRRWEIPDVIEPGVPFLVEEAEETDEGKRLFAIFRRGSAASKEE